MKFERVSARIHPSDKEKLSKTGYNARQAIEYFNSISCNEVDQLSIEEYFLNKEIEDMKYDLISKEAKLEDIQKRKDEIYKGNLSQLRVQSYQKIIGMYTDVDDKTSVTTQAFEEFIEMRFIENTIVRELASVQCPLDEYKEGLLNYYTDVILVGRTID